MHNGLYDSLGRIGDFEAAGKRTVPLLITHSFKADKTHRTYLSRPSSGVEAPWCIFCGKDKTHVNHPQT